MHQWFAAALLAIVCTSALVAADAKPQRAHGTVVSVDDTSLVLAIIAKEDEEAEEKTFVIDEGTKVKVGDTIAAADLSEGTMVMVRYMENEDGDLVAKQVGAVREKGPKKDKKDKKKKQKEEPEESDDEDFDGDDSQE